MAVFEEKELPPAWQPAPRLEGPRKGPEDGETCHQIPHGPLSHALTPGKRFTTVFPSVRWER